MVEENEQSQGGETGARLSESASEQPAERHASVSEMLQLSEGKGLNVRPMNLAPVAERPVEPGQIPPPELAPQPQMSATPTASAAPETPTE